MNGTEVTSGETTVCSIKSNNKAYKASTYEYTYKPCHCHPPIFISDTHLPQPG